MINVPTSHGIYEKIPSSELNFAKSNDLDSIIMRVNSQNRAEVRTCSRQSTSVRVDDIGNGLTPFHKKKKKLLHFEMLIRLMT